MIYIFLISISLPVAIWGIFIEKKKLGKVFGVLGVVSILVSAWLGYKDSNQIVSLSAQVTFDTKLEESKFQDSSMTSFQEGSMAYIAFFEKNNLVSVIPSRYVAQKSTDPHSINLSAQFDISADPRVAQIKGNISDLKNSDMVQLGIPSHIYTYYGTSTIQGGSIELLINGSDKIVIQLPQYTIDDDNPMVLPIRFP